MAKKSFFAVPSALVRNMSGFSSLSPVSFTEIVKKELIEGEPAERVKEIWEAYHTTSRSSVGLTLPAKDYAVVQERLKESPLFIWPLFKDEKKESHVILLSQLQTKFIVLTFLDEYKNNPETAAPWLSLVLFDDMIGSKDLALVRSDFTPQMNKEEGEIVTKMILQAYHDDEAYNTYIRPFTQTPEKFDFAAYMKYFGDMHDIIVSTSGAEEGAESSESEKSI
jgi:ATP synthase F1 complex assembly factor 1